MVPVPKPVVISAKGAPPKQDNPRVFLDIAIDGVPIGRLNIELFSKQVPRTAENFRRLCVGDCKTSQGKRLWYKGAKFFSVIPGFVAVTGDIENDNGTGGQSIYGKYFPDEQIVIPHDRRGILSMMSFENDTNNSQFFITFDEAKHLDQYHVAFGRVVGSAGVLDRIEKCQVDAFSSPTKTITIADCGMLKS